MIFSIYQLYQGLFFQFTKWVFMRNEIIRALLNLFWFFSYLKEFILDFLCISLKMFGYGDFCRNFRGFLFILGIKIHILVERLTFNFVFILKALFEFLNKVEAILRHCQMTIAICWFDSFCFKWVLVPCVYHLIKFKFYFLYLSNCLFKRLSSPSFKSQIKLF